MESSIQAHNTGMIAMAQISSKQPCLIYINPWLIMFGLPSFSDIIIQQMAIINQNNAIISIMLTEIISENKLLQNSNVKNPHHFSSDFYVNIMYNLRLPF